MPHTFTYVNEEQCAATVQVLDGDSSPLEETPTATTATVDVSPPEVPCLVPSAQQRAYYAATYSRMLAKAREVRQDRAKAHAVAQQSVHWEYTDNGTDQMDTWSVDSEESEEQPTKVSSVEQENRAYYAEVYSGMCEKVRQLRQDRQKAWAAAYSFVHFDYVDNPTDQDMWSEQPTKQLQEEATGHTNATGDTRNNAKERVPPRKVSSVQIPIHYEDDNPLPCSLCGAGVEETDMMHQRAKRWYCSGCWPRMALVDASRAHEPVPPPPPQESPPRLAFLRKLKATNTKRRRRSRPQQPAQVTSTKKPTMKERKATNRAKPTGEPSMVTPMDLEAIWQKSVACKLDGGELEIGD